MAPKKTKQPPLDLVSVRNNMEQLRELVITLGLPYTHVRRMDDALLVINKVETKLEHGKPKA